MVLFHFGSFLAFWLGHNTGMESQHLGNQLCSDVGGSRALWRVREPQRSNSRGTNRSDTTEDDRMTGFTGQDGHHDNKQDEHQLDLSAAVFPCSLPGLCFDAPCWTSALLCVWTCSCSFFFYLSHGERYSHLLFVCLLKQACSLYYKHLPTNTSRSEGQKFNRKVSRNSLRPAKISFHIKPPVSYWIKQDMLGVNK